MPDLPLNIYNTLLVKSTTGGKLLVDSATLIDLANANQLDLLLKTGRQVVITQSVRDEAVSNLNFENDRKINDWINANQGNGPVIVDLNPNYPAVAPGNQAGERSFVVYNSAHPSEDIRIVSGDATFISNGEPTYGVPPGRNLAGTSGPNLTTTEFINDLLFSGAISPVQHTNAVISIDVAGDIVGAQKAILLRPFEKITIIDATGRPNEVWHLGLGVVRLNPEGVPVEIVTPNGFMKIPPGGGLPLDYTDLPGLPDASSLSFAVAEDSNGQFHIVGTDDGGNSPIATLNASFDPISGAFSIVGVYDNESNLIGKIDTAENEPWLHQITKTDSMGRVEEIVTGYDDGATVGEVYSYIGENISVIKEIDVLEVGASIEITTTYDGGGEIIAQEFGDIEYANQSVSLGEIGQTLGSQLGRILGGDSVFGQVAASTVLGTLLGNLGNFIQTNAGQSLIGENALGGTPMDKEIGTTFDNFVDNFGSNLRGQVTNVLSSILMGELADALDLEGFEGALFVTVGNTITSQFIGNVVNIATGVQGASLFAGFEAAQLALNIGNAFGAFFGSQLAAEIITPESPEAALFGAAGSAIGTAIGTALLAGIPLIGPFLGAFFGNVIGTFLGNLFGDEPDPPTARAIVGLDPLTGELVMTSLSSTGEGNRAFARALANNFIQTIEDVAETAGGIIDPIHGIRLRDFGHTDASIYTRGLGEGPADSLALKLRTGDASLLLQHAISKTLADLQIVGGDPVVRRAFYQSRDDGMVALGFDLQVAKDYRLYLENTTLINTLIEADGEGAFAAAPVAAIQAPLHGPAAGFG